MEGITTALETSFATIQADALNIVAKAVPPALVLVGTVLVVTIGIKVFKKLTGKV